VVVVDGTRVVQGAAPAGGDAPHQPCVLERVEACIDRRQRDVGQSLPDRGEELLGAHVAPQLDERLMDQEPLRRHPIAGGPQGLRHPLPLADLAGADFHLRSQTSLNL
jgi:hypothetical protein